MLRLSLLSMTGAALLLSAPLRARAERPGPMAAAAPTASESGAPGAPRATNPDPTSPVARPSIPALLDTLLHNAETRTETVKSLLATGDEGLQPLFRNLFKGNVYAYAAEGSADTLLVMAGAEEEREGEAWVPLFRPYPAAPMSGEDGRPAFARTADLVEVEGRDPGREHREHDEQQHDQQAEDQHAALEAGGGAHRRDAGDAAALGGAELLDRGLDLGQ